MDDWPFQIEYKLKLEQFLANQIPEFMKGLEPLYKNNQGSRDYITNHFVRFWAMIREIEKVCPHPKTSCEIGSFLPYTTYYFGGQIDLFDYVENFYPDAKPYCADGVTLRTINIATESFPEKTYDLVNCSEVMEHLNCNLFDFEKKVIRLLHPGSLLVVTYPTIGTNAKDYAEDYGNNASWQEGHVREFTEATIPLFFRDLEPVFATRINYPAYGPIAIRGYRR
jgi:SAM-dependent methyltransferase